MILDRRVGVGFVVIALPVGQNVAPLSAKRRRTNMERWLRVVALVAAALYVVVGVGELIFADESLGRRILFAVVLLVFAVLVVGGVALIAQRPWIGAAVASVGAIAAGFALFWTVAAIVLGLAIVVLSVMVARRSAATQRRLA